MKKTKASKFFNRNSSVKDYSDMYKKLRLDIRYPANVKREQIFIKLLKEHNPKKIVDAGCGAGMPLIDIKKQTTNEIEKYESEKIVNKQNIKLFVNSVLSQLYQIKNDTKKHILNQNKIITKQSNLLKELNNKDLQLILQNAKNKEQMNQSIQQYV